jgi:hypothetical protein
LKKIPHAQGVSRAIRSVRVAAKKALKGLNLAAGQRMAKGDYATAEALAAKGKELRQFQEEVESLRKRWREVSGGGGGAGKKTTTPLWLYYQPILQALAQAGGECRRAELEPRVERVMGASLKAGDRWQVMIRRARKPLAAEGWIEPGTGKLWRITPSGRRTAEQPMSKDPAERKQS